MSLAEPSLTGALAELVDRLPETTVMAIGDLMLDRYVYGRVERISPEAPIPVLQVVREEAMLGGVGNVVRNLAALGARVRLVTVTGDDGAAGEVRRLLDAERGLRAKVFIDPARPTTIKTRLVAGAQQMLRADWEQVRALPPAFEDAVVAAFQTLLPECGAVILSDYGKGVLTDRVIAEVITAAREAGRPVVVDPKGRNFLRYKGAAAVAPNRRELAEATGMAVEGDEAILAAARRVIEGAGVEVCLVTRSEEGMTLVSADQVAHLRAEARQVYDVSGAGDTVVAAYAAGLAAGVEPGLAARLANAAAGVVVGKAGTSTVSPEELTEALHRADLVAAEAKLASRQAALATVERWRRAGLSVGFTNGCFDLLHPGHISLLSQARACCDRLVVGLNSDQSVARLKGPDRPVQGEAARATVLGSLAAVDMVVVFAEDTPIELIRALRPDILVKGADYTIETVVGADIVQAYGGRVMLADLVPGHSTTGTIRRLRG